MSKEQVTESIIHRINANDDKAFSLFYQAYYVYLNSVIVYYINDKSASREIVNDIFLSIWNKRGALTYPIHSYLMKSVQNACIDYLRSQQSLSQALGNYKEQFCISYQENYIRTTPDPLNYVELRQTEEEISKAIRELPLRCRQIFTSYYYDGKAVDEIAQELRLSKSTVRVQLKNSIDRLKLLLEHLLLFFSFLL